MRRFLILFALLLVVLYVAIAIRPVNDRVVVPFTALIARASGAVLRLSGESVAVGGTVISSGRFAINIENGCNGLETTLLVVSAVLAFPASWRARAAGLLAGFAVIQAVNLVRVATLFWIGVHRPALFGSAHTLVWQSLVVLVGVGFFVVWAKRAAPRRAA